MHVNERVGVLVYSLDMFVCSVYVCGCVCVLLCVCVFRLCVCVFVCGMYICVCL